jgi:outer membrane protein OmpA-like peptidoglycan-associated protein
MRKTLGAVVILTGALLAGGCATKKYVKQTADPIQAKLDKVGDQANKTGTSLEEARKDIERHDVAINNVKEKADGADARAGDALKKAGEAGQAAAEARTVADKTGRDLSSLRSTFGDTIKNLDDYKLQAETMVTFKFGQDKLTPESQEKLDQFAKEHAGARRYFIAVEGFTDAIGNVDYNEALSRRRADKVVAYLVTKHDIPVYRIQMIGLGKEKPVDEGKNREARAKNRRVEVKMYTAEATPAMSQLQD